MVNFYIIFWLITGISAALYLDYMMMHDDFVRWYIDQDIEDSADESNMSVEEYRNMVRIMVTIITIILGPTFWVYYIIDNW